MTVYEKEKIVKLVNRIQNQDSTATELLYKLLANKIYYYALKLVRNPEDAKDIMQESFIQAFQKIDTLQQPESFCSWLYCITSNKCKNFFKKNSKVTLMETEMLEDVEWIDDDEAILPESALNQAETADLMKQIIDQLPEAQRSCIILYYFNELSVKEIAQALECSEGTIKSRLNYGRKQIKEGVLELEHKKGTKLYNLAPLSLLLSLLRNTGPDETLSPETLASSWQTVLPTLSTSATKNASSAILSRAVGSLAKSKVIALVAAGGILATTATVYIATHQPKETSSPIVSEKAIHSNNSAEYNLYEHENITHTTNHRINVPSEEPTPLTFKDPYLEQAVRLIIHKPEGEIYEEDVRTINSLLIFGKYVTTTPKGRIIWRVNDENFITQFGVPLSDSEIEALGMYKLDDYITSFSDLKQFPVFSSLTLNSTPSISDEELGELEAMGILVSID